MSMGKEHVKKETTSVLEFNVYFNILEYAQARGLISFGSGS